METRKIKISPEVLRLDLSGITYSGESFGYYPPLKNILSGGTAGKSLLNNLSIPILFTQDYQDIGYYSPFDGFLSHCNEQLNFTFEKGSGAREIKIYNTSDTKLKYIKNTTFTISWGDGTAAQTFTEIFPTPKTHTYTSDGTYTISLSGLNNIGIFVIRKKITIPFNKVVPLTPFGTVNFTNPNPIGSWSATPTSQNYIYPFDSGNTIDDQLFFQNTFTTANNLPIPFIVSGYTNSRLNELFIYGPNKLSSTNNIFPTIFLKDGTTGKTISTSSSYTSYTINTMTYYDYPNGVSIFMVESSGITRDMIVQSAITKFDYLLNIINDTEIQSNVFIERGKNSGTENFRRLGEVGSTGELETYGYNFFDVRFFNDI